MKKLLSLVSSGALVALLFVGAGVQAQVSGSADTSVDSQGTSPLQDPDSERIDTSPYPETVDIYGDADAGSDPATGTDSSGGSAEAGTSGTVTSFTLTQEDAASASLDSASASLTASGVVSSEDLSAFATSHMKRDARIENIEVSANEVSLEYRKEARFLGFVPAKLSATANVKSNGDVEVDYPWYRFLFAVEGADEAEAQLETRVAELMTGSSGAFSAAVQAAIIESIHVAFSGDASATADAGVTADMVGRPEDMTVSGEATGEAAADVPAGDASADASGSASGSADSGE